MENIEHVIKKVSKYVTFGQPISSGSVYSQRLSDPRIPIVAYYMSMKKQSENEEYYHEIWLKKDGTFAVIEAWYKESIVSRKLLHDNLEFDQISSLFGEEEASHIILRMTEIIQKSEKEDWSRSRSRTRSRA